jgi:hypothetical protein
MPREMKPDKTKQNKNKQTQNEPNQAISGIHPVPDDDDDDDDGGGDDDDDVLIVRSRLGRCLPSRLSSVIFSRQATFDALHPHVEVCDNPTQALHTVQGLGFRVSPQRPGTSRRRCLGFRV